MATATNKSNSTDEHNEQDARFGFACLRNIRDGKIDLSGVADALGYKNVNSVGNRFRQMRGKFGFTSLECTTGASPAKPKPTKKAAAKGASQDNMEDENEDPGTGSEAPAKKGPGRPAKKPRKGAKVSTDKPIPATGPAVKNEESGDDEGQETSKAGFSVEVKNEEGFFKEENE